MTYGLNGLSITIPLTNRVREPYCKSQTVFFPLQFMTRVRRTKAINWRGKNVVCNLQYRLLTRLLRGIFMHFAQKSVLEWTLKMAGWKSFLKLSDIRFVYRKLMLSGNPRTIQSLHQPPVRTPRITENSSNSEALASGDNRKLRLRCRWIWRPTEHRTRA